MGTRIARQSVLLEGLLSKPVTAQFTDPDLSSSGGALLLKALDESLGLTRRLASCVQDDRDASRVTHDLQTLLRQRVFALCCGYEDANDAARYQNDPMQKLLCDRDSQGDALASQPTLSRFENAVSRIDLYRMADALADVIIARHKKRLGRRAKVVTIDLDPTVNYTHGLQQLTMFNGFYDGHCYLPLMAHVSFNEEPDQYLVGAVLRPGNAGNAGVIGVLRRLIEKVKQSFPRSEIVVRLDGGLSQPEVLGFLDRTRVHYLVGFAGNKVLALYSNHALARAQRHFEDYGETVQFFGSTRDYAARSWGKRRRVIYKAEVVQFPDRAPRENVRYVVTNMKGSAEDLYAQYVLRGDSENRIKEAKLAIHIDRLSCSRFYANQFRALLGAAAYALFQELRLRARRTPAARWQVERIRSCLIQIAARVTSSVRRLVINLPRSHPWGALWTRLASACL